MSHQVYDSNPKTDIRDAIIISVFASGVMITFFGCLALTVMSLGALVISLDFGVAGWTCLAGLATMAIGIVITYLSIWLVKGYKINLDNPTKIVKEELHIVVHVVSLIITIIVISIILVCCLTTDM